MQDAPGPDDILAAVTAYLRAEIMPKLSGGDAFQLRVATNALDLVRREIARPAETEAQETKRLAAFLGHDAPAEALNAELALRIAAGEIDRDSPDLQALLWAMTEAKLAVDQPGYPGLLHALRLKDAAAQQETRT